MLGCHSDMETKATAASAATVLILNWITVKWRQRWERWSVSQSTMVELHLKTDDGQLPWQCMNVFFPHVCHLSLQTTPTSLPPTQTIIWQFAAAAAESRLCFPKGCHFLCSNKKIKEIRNSFFQLQTLWFYAIFMWLRNKNCDRSWCRSSLVQHMASLLIQSKCFNLAEKWLFHSKHALSLFKSYCKRCLKL